MPAHDVPAARNLAACRGHLRCRVPDHGRGHPHARPRRGRCSVVSGGELGGRGPTGRSAGAASVSLLVVQRCGGHASGAVRACTWGGDASGVPQLTGSRSRRRGILLGQGGVVPLWVGSWWARGGAVAFASTTFGRKGGAEQAGRRGQQSAGGREDRQSRQRAGQSRSRRQAAGQRRQQGCEVLQADPSTCSRR
jgi:hypothetical protein